MTNPIHTPAVEALFEEAIASGNAAAEAQAELTRQAARRREAVTRLREEGISYGQIANRLGITRSGVQSILQGPRQT